MGVVDRSATDLLELYADSYFAADTERGVGYADYPYTAEHSTAWAAALVPLISEPGSNVLDIGCADGHLLKKLVDEYDCFGIEVNIEMARRATAAGVKIIAHDLNDLPPDARYRASFDVVTAIAVFEHLENFRAGVESALELLRPAGVLIFEVPLIGGTADDGVWFASSLEHVAYPTQSAITHLFERELRRPVAGREVLIEDFGTTCVGVVGPEAVRRDFLAIADTPLQELGPAARRFRFLFDVVHAGTVTPAHAQVLGELRADLNEFSLRRVAELWTRSEERLATTRASLEETRESLKETVAAWKDVQEYLRSVEEARDWHERRSKHAEGAG